MPNPQNVTHIQTEFLRFDPQNPRFYRLNDAGSVKEVVEEMLDEESVQDLMLSIGQKGYFEGEPLLVVKSEAEDPANKDYIVVEGNRRLAAVKLLNEQLQPPSRRNASIKEIRDGAVVDPPTELPCLIYDERRDILRYLGYRHITGIKEWDSLSKAKYLAQLKEEFYDALSEPDQLKSLAKDIGSRSDYVGQLLTALAMYISAESQRFFDLPIKASDVEFSYLTTALNYTNICEWLGLNGRIDIEMSGLDEGNLKRAFAWMFSKDQQGRTILGESRNLDQLAAVVSSDDAIANLEETGKLSEAYLFTDGPSVALERALENALSKVQVAWNLIPKTKPLTDSHLSLAEHLADNARSARNSIREKLEE